MSHIVTILTSGSYFQDNFNRPANTETLGGTWKYLLPDGSKFGINADGQAYVAQNPTFEVIAYNDLGAWNIDLSCTYPVADDTSCMILRYTPGSGAKNWYNITQTGGGISVYKTDSNSQWTLLGTGMTPLDTPFRVGALAIGNQITVSYNGTNLLTITDVDPLTGTAFGLRNGNNASGFWDDFNARSV